MTDNIVKIKKLLIHLEDAIRLHQLFIKYKNILKQIPNHYDMEELELIYQKYRDTESALLMNIQVLGEELSKLDQKILNNYFIGIDLNRLRKTRHVISHDYTNVNNFILTDVITKDLHPIYQAMINYLKDNGVIYP